MAQALKIVSELLEDELQEASAYRLRIFGPNIDEQGEFFASNNPIVDFVKSMRKDAIIKTVDDVNRYIDFYTKNGYTFVISDHKSLIVYSNTIPKFGKEAIFKLEQTLGMTPQTPVIWNSESPVAAAQKIYGQPEHKNQGGARVGTFGGITGPGLFKNVNALNQKAIEKGIRTGYAYVIKYPGASYAVITPAKFRFDAAAISNLERELGINRQTPVKWYVGSTNPANSVVTSADKAIYGNIGTPVSPAAPAAPAPTQPPTP